MVAKSEMAMTCTPSQEAPSHASHSQETSSLEEVPRGECSQPGSRRSESSQGASPSSETSICKEKYTVGPGYVVEKLEDKDNAGYIAWWRYRLNQLLPLTAVSAIAAYWLYITFRIRCAVMTQHINHTFYPMAWLFLAVELGLAVPSLLQQTLQCFSLRARHRPRLRITGEHVPMVDVFITCAGEEVAVILDTVRAAVDVDWPRDKFRVVILDDKSSEEVRREVQLLSLEHPNVFYTARIKTKGVPHHYKAGNLNHGLTYVKGLQGGNAEFVAALDADMIAERFWLRAILANLLSDPEVALACPPQLFYNIPKNDPLYQNLAFFFHILEGVKDSIGSAWCTGSGYAVRRSALDEIGGFPTGSLAEDVCCSSMLLGAGWKTCFVHEPLQYGMVPDSFAGHIKQRTRWTIGTAQTAARLNYFLFGQVCTKMSLFQRFCGLVFSLNNLATVPLTASLLLFPVALGSGSRLVAYTDYDQLRWLIRLAFLTLLAHRINDWIAFTPAGYRFAWRGNLGSIWMAPYHAIAIVRSFVLPGWLGGKIATFSSSGSIDSVINERDTRARAPLMRRLKAIWWNGGVLIHVFYFLFTVGAVASSVSRAFTKTPDDYRDRLFYILTHTAWPPVTWLIALAACAIPIKYSMSPPAMPDRDDLLLREKGTDIAHPRTGAKRARWGHSNLLHEGFYALVTLYTTALFFGSWFL